MFALLSLTLRECWHVVLGAQWMLLTQHEIRRKTKRDDLGNFERGRMIQFKAAAEQIRQRGPKKLTVQQLLALFGQQRRGPHVAEQIDFMMRFY
jgi:hypothetical protein